MTKRRGNGEGGIYKAADGYWHASIEMGWVAGKRKRWTAKAKTKARLMDKLEQARRELATTGTIAAKDVTVTQWFDRWLPTTRESTAPNTVKQREYSRRHVDAAIGSIPLHRLTPMMVQGMVDSIIADGRHPTAVKARDVLRTALNAAVAEGLVIRNVADYVRVPSHAGKERTPLTAEQARKLIANTKDDRLGSLWLFALMTGLRRGEMVGLTWDRLDLATGTADVSWQLHRLAYSHGCEKKPCGRRFAGDCPSRFMDLPKTQEHTSVVGSLVLSRPKTKRSRRRVPLAPILVERLREHRKATLSEPNPHGFVWARPDGMPLDPEQALAAWHEALAANEIPATPLHASRHTTATLLMEAGVPTKVISELVGHTNIAMTEAYQHADLSATMAAVIELGERLSS